MRFEGRMAAVVGGPRFAVSHDTAGLGQWVHRLNQRAPRNKVIVRPRQQANSHRLGCVVQRQRLSASTSAARGSLMTVEKTLRLESTQRFPLFRRRDDGA
jgi:hypothetical protein